jgi:hypothetical protein
VKVVIWRFIPVSQADELLSSQAPEFEISQKKSISKTGLYGFTTLLVASSREGCSRLEALKRLLSRLQTYHFYQNDLVAWKIVKIRGCPPESW